MHTCRQLDCVAAQTVNELYRVSNDDEARTLLVDIATNVRSMETVTYPSRYPKLRNPLTSSSLLYHACSGGMGV